LHLARFAALSAAHTLASPVVRVIANSRAPSLRGHYSASSLLRAPPPPSRLPPISQCFWLYGFRLRRFRDGTRRLSPVAQHALVTVLPLLPRRSGSPPQPACDDPCCLRPEGEGLGLQSSFFSRPPMGSLALRPGDSLAILKMALSVGFIRFVSSTNATLATGT